jgi:cell division protein FtsW
MNARTSFHALVAFGVVSLLAVQTLVIVGGNIKLIPLTGVTLPFISSGGSSMVSLMGAMGMLLGVSSLNAGDEAEDLKRLEWREGGV